MGKKKNRRKALSRIDLERPQDVVETPRRILIVCEGEKTEPNYFFGLIRYHKLTATRVDVKGDGGSSPKSIVNYAKDLLRESAEDNNEYDIVFCVFDKDSHARYLEAIGDIMHSGNETIKCCNSIPSFEFWYLLHYVETRRAYVGGSGKSPSDQVESDLKKEAGSYSKSDPDMYKKLYGRQDRAIERAKRVLRDAESVGEFNPSTRVHEIVCELLGK